MKMIETWFVTHSQHSSLLLLNGKSGMGKTCLITRFLDTYNEEKIITAKGKFDQDPSSRRGFSAVTEILSQLYSLCISFGHRFQTQLTDMLMSQLNGTESALVNVCSEWGDLFETIGQMSVGTPEEEVARINNAIAICLKCVCAAMGLQEDSLCLIFGL